MSKKKKEKKGLSDGGRIALFTFVIIVVISLIGVSSYFLLVPKNDEKPQEEIKKNAKSIEGYGITVDDLDTNIYKEEFELLRKNLTSDNINYDDYAESVAKLFIIDLYTIKNKINKYDVGGTEFVLPEGKDNYITNVSDTIYKYVEDNTNGSRTQKLPVVSGVTITDTEESTFEIESEKKKYDSYVFNIEIEYTNDYGYDKKAEVIVINKDNFMYVVEKN